MALVDYAIYIDNDGSDNYSPQAFKSPAVRPSGGTRLSIPVVENNAQASVPVAITNATNATPIVITSTAHGLAVDDTVFIQSVGGNTAANGTFIVSAVADANTYTLRDSAGNAAYTSGGWGTKLPRTKSIITALAMATNAVVNDNAA